MSERVTWNGLTARYAEHERALMRELPRDEAAVLHEMKALLDATIVRAGTTPAWDDRRNTSMVRQTYRYADFVADGGLEHEPPAEPDAEQLELG